MHVSADHIAQLETALAAAEPLVLLPPLHPRYLQSLLGRWVERGPDRREVRLVEPYRGSRKILPDRVDPGTGTDRGDDLGTWLDEAELPPGGADRWQRVWWIPDLSEAWTDPRTCGILASICREAATRDLRLRILLRAPTAPLPASLKPWARAVELLAPKAREDDADSFAIDVLDGGGSLSGPGWQRLSERLAAFEAEGTPARAELSMLLQGLDAAAVNIVIEAVARWLGSRPPGAAAAGWPALRTRLEKEREGQLKQASGLTIERKTDETLEGMPRFQRYLEYVSVLFHDHRFERKVGGPTPRGVLLVGLPGCGKSLAARVTAEKLDVPLLRMDVGAMMGRYLGESEANLQRALDAAEAAAPCVLWVDELEKALGGMGTDGGDGGGTGKRMLGQLLTWMQSHKSSVYLFATANAVEALPPELLRRGRFDELWRVMLPEDDERELILRAKLKELGGECDPALLTDDSPQRAALVKSTKGYTGADIGSLVREAWMRARVFEEKVTAQRLEEVQRGDFQPMSEQFSTKIKESSDKLKEHGFRNVWCPPDQLAGPPPSDRMGKKGRLRGALAELWRTKAPVLAVFRSRGDTTYAIVVSPGDGASRDAAVAKTAHSWSEWYGASHKPVSLERDGRAVAVRGLTRRKQHVPAKLCWVGEDPGELQLEVDGTVYVLDGLLSPEPKPKPSAEPPAPTVRAVRSAAQSLQPPLDTIWTASEPMAFAVGRSSIRVFVVQPASAGSPRPAEVRHDSGRTLVTLTPVDGQLAIDGLTDPSGMPVYASLQARDGRIVLRMDGTLHTQLEGVQPEAELFGERSSSPSPRPTGTTKSKATPAVRSTKTSSKGEPFFVWSGERFTVTPDITGKKVQIQDSRRNQTTGKVKAASSTELIIHTASTSPRGGVSIRSKRIAWSAPSGSVSQEQLVLSAQEAGAELHGVKFGGRWASLAGKLSQ